MINGVLWNIIRWMWLFTNWLWKVKQVERNIANNEIKITTIKKDPIINYIYGLNYMKGEWKICQMKQEEC